jgi:uncharacterized membrane protein
VIRATWRKHFSVLRNRLYLYPSPEPMPRTRLFWVAMGLVTIAVVLFCSYFIIYLTRGQSAYLTNAEDLGIMDQAIWNTAHGNMLHMTICNIISDSNCYSPDGVTRFAIHFEPILFPVSLLYLVWPGPQTLLVLQTLVVAMGAYPAFWLARLRLRNDLAGVVIALLYLLYPAQQQATVFDFHAVTFTAALLLFVLYFMYTRRTVLVFVFAILAMACKEEIPLVIAMFGLWSVIFQQRWRSGLGLVLLAVAWAALALFYIPPHFSPTGHPLLIGRYAALGKGPVQIVYNILRHPGTFLHQYVLESNHIFYLRILLSPAAYLPMLAPWVLVLALPSLAINMLSSDNQMYTGLFQYNAEIVPILIFATIEAMVLILWLVQMLLNWLQMRASKEAQKQAETPPSSEWEQRRRSPGRTWLPGRIVHVGLLTALLAGVLVTSVRSDYTFHGVLPFSKGFVWPVVTAHAELAQHFIDMIPPDASVSAQSKLVPHLSQRTNVYLFPYGDGMAHNNAVAPATADYIFLDVTGDIYPFYAYPTYTLEVKRILFSGNYGVVAAQDGYLLLKRGLPAPALSPNSVVEPGNDFNTIRALPDLPQDFCSPIYVSPHAVTHPMKVTFTAPGGSVDLIGFSVGAPSVFSHSGGYMAITTYWQISAPLTSALQILFLTEGKDGKEYFASTDVPALFWCETTTWKPGMVIQLTSRVFGLQYSHVPNGLAHISIALLPLVQSSSTIMDVHARLPLHIVNVPDTVASTQGTNALELKSIKLVP